MHMGGIHPKIGLCPYKLRQANTREHREYWWARVSEAVALRAIHNGDYGEPPRSRCNAFTVLHYIRAGHSVVRKYNFGRAKCTLRCLPPPPHVRTVNRMYIRGEAGEAHVCSKKPPRPSLNSVTLVMSSSFSRVTSFSKSFTLSMPTT